MNDEETRGPLVTAMSSGRLQKKEARKEKRHRLWKEKSRRGVEQATSIPVSRLQGITPSPAAVAGAPAPADSAWWMDPKILLLGAAALLILMRGKK